MGKKLKIYFICGNGLGSSLASQMVADEVLQSNGFYENLDHESVSSAVALKADIIVSGENFKSQFSKYDLDPSITFVFLHNIVDKAEINEKLIPVVEKLSNN